MNTASTCRPTSRPPRRPWPTGKGGVSRASQILQLLAALVVLAVTATAGGCTDSGPTAGSTADAGLDIPKVDILAADLPDVPTAGALRECPGGYGCACTVAADCTWGAPCLEAPDGSRRCSTPCPLGCSDDETCKTLTVEDGATAPFATGDQWCVPRGGLSCDPCTTSADCAVPGYADAACIPYGDSGRFCGVPCQGDADCSGGMVCQAVKSVDRGLVQQCVRKEAGELAECPCSGRAIAAGASTVCGSGSCDGTRTCSEAGLSACSAATPGPETCNGLDDDCNGQTDDVVVCNDNNGCTTDSCAGAQGCLFAPANGEPCDADGSVCTANDACQAGVCVAGAGIVCDDGNPCTTQTCDKAKGCLTTFTAGPCDDGAPCTTGDTCQNGQCQPGKPKLCDDAEDCTGDSCDPTTGDCVFAPSDGGPCNDNNACTGADSCAVGLCGGVTITCDDANPCTADSCSAGTGCASLPTDGTPCDDGNACTAGDVCVIGQCSGGAPVACDGGGPCLASACNPDSGVCTDSPKTGGTLCSDGDPCTEADNCQNGSCIGTAKVCDDANACTVDACSPGGGCVFVPTNTTCSDNDACTEDDNCGTGSCLGTALVCTDDNPCTSDSCNKATGCVYLNNTNACDDSDACTSGDTCSGGSCAPGADTCECRQTADCANKEDNDRCNGTLICSNNSCVVDLATIVTCDTALDTVCRQTACEPTSGECLPVDATSTLACDDNDPCTEGDQCNGSGLCVSGPDTCECRQTSDCAALEDGDLCNGTLICQDNACVLDLASPVTCDTSNDTVCSQTSCEPNTGECLAVDVTTAVACDDGDACTTGDVCSGKDCNGTTTTCDDGNPCTADFCNPVSGACDASATTSSCDDNNACTSGDTCKNSACEGEPIAPCNDDNPCTDDTCDLAVGCTFTDNTADCSDGEACTTGDACEAGSCVAGPFTCDCADTEDCVDQEDGNACNGTLVCDAGECVLDLASVVTCDTSADTTCLYNACEAASGDCVMTAALDSISCSDGSPCTEADACVAGSCVGSAKTCNDSNLCTDDSCDGSSGDCVFLANSATCTDSNACTQNDICLSKACTGTALDCSDNNPCTDTGCDLATGCTVTNNTDNCSDGLACTLGDVCADGTCQGNAKVCDDNNLCTNDSCDASSGSCVFLANTVTCTDGDACTENDTCSNKACVGSTVDCSDGNPCTDNGCDLALGCTLTENTAPCEDGDTCTSNDSCLEGSCVPGNFICDCLQDNDCAGGEDGNLCNGTLHCVDNDCVLDAATIVVCDTSADTACNQATCVPLSGACTLTDLPNGVTCTDNLLCTTGDTCDSGTCVGNALTCDDSNPCTDDSCDSLTGGCVFLANSVTCTDGDACTENDTCSAKACSGTAKVCSDSNPCTDASCESGTGNCLFPNNTASCNDNNACTDFDVCGGGTCGGTAKVCNDGLPCTIDACDMAIGCTTTANVGGSCDDGNACTESETCNAGTCSGPAKTCADGVACTDDDCDPSIGCVFTNLSGEACDDGNHCTTSDICTAGTCGGTPPTEAVTSVAGDGQLGTASGQPLSSQFVQVRDVLDDGAGKIYLSDGDLNGGGHRIRLISGTSLNTLAGVGLADFLDGPLASARFWNPAGMALFQGKLVVADSGNQRIRLIDEDPSNAVVSTLAGTAPEAGFPQLSAEGGFVNGDATIARFNNPVDLAATATGTALYIADRDNHCVRKYDQDTNAVSTAVGTCLQPGQIDGDAATARLDSPTSLAIDASGTTLFVGQQNGFIRRVDLATGDVTTVVIDPAGDVPGPYAAITGLTLWTSGAWPYLASAHADGRIFITPLNSDPLLVGKNVWAGAAENAFVNGTPQQARFVLTGGIQAIAQDTLLVVDTGAYRLRKVQRSAIFCLPLPD